MTQEITEYNATETALTALSQRLKDVVYEIQTAAGMESARTDRRELVSLRTALELKRKEIKAPALQKCKDIDSEAERIKAAIIALEDPIDAQIKAEEARIEAIREQKREAERKRISAIQERINIFRNAPINAATRTALEIGYAIEKLKAAPVTAELYQELVEEAEKARTDCITALTELQQKKHLEEEEAERIRVEQEKAEAERLEKERLQQVEKEKLEAESKRLEEERLENERKEAKLKKEKEDFEAFQLKEKQEQEEKERIGREAKEAGDKRIAAEKAEIEREKAEIQAQKEAELQKPVYDYEIILRRSHEGWKGIFRSFTTEKFYTTPSKALKEVEVWIMENQNSEKG